MVHRMMRRGALVAPAVAGVLWLIDGPKWAFSAAIGVVLTLANLWLAAQMIGRVADNNPQLLLFAALMAMTLGLVLLVALALALRALDLVYFPVTGFTLIGAHFLLVLWEAADAYPTQGNTQAASPRPVEAEGS